MDAQTLLLALQQAGLSVTGICVIDPADPTTWRFDGKLTDAERTHAILIVQGQILAAANPPLITTPVATLDQVIAWTASKLVVPEDAARTAILALPPVYVPPTKGP